MQDNRPMSIIYEALKKVEKLQTVSGALPTTAQNVKHSKIKAYFFYSLVVVFGILIANIIFMLITGPSSTPAIKTESTVKNPPLLLKNQEPAVVKITPVEPPLEVLQEVVQPQEKTPPKLTLSGLFFSQNQGYVLINNQILKEGDTIEGATVKRILLDGVELEAGGAIIKLSNNQ